MDCSWEAELDGAEVVLVDLGGVLTPDPWETVLLDTGGVADQLGIPRQAAESAGRRIWRRHATSTTSEEEWLDDLARETGTTVPWEVWDRAARRLIVPNTKLLDALQRLAADGVRTGVVTNNTEFFLARQDQVLHLDRWVDPRLVLSSHRAGREKHDGLLEAAAARVAARGTVYLDDDTGNVQLAAALGMRARQYRMQPHRNGAGAVDGEPADGEAQTLF